MDRGKERQGPIGLKEQEFEALVALIRVMVGMDSDFTEAESDAIGSIAIEVGEEAFWRHMQEAAKAELTLQGVLDLAKGVERTDA